MSLETKSDKTKVFNLSCTGVGHIVIINLYGRHNARHFNKNMALIPACGSGYGSYVHLS